MAARIVPLDLALQGGGSHGAFTWGVLDRLLEDETIEVAGISGTSAGAMNAVALAAGLMEDGRAGARRTLRLLWEQVAKMTPWQAVDLFGSAPESMSAAYNPWAEFGRSWGEAWQSTAKTWSDNLQQWWPRTLRSNLSPYQFNPLNLNPLRNMLEKTIDFERVRSCHKTRLFIAATQVRTGSLRIFRQHEVTIDVVLASACLPLLFQAVEIGGEAYWDGGFAGNPSLLPLITESPADDLMLVQINPRIRPDVPTAAADILDRMNEVTFNTSLLKEMRSIGLIRQLMAAEGRPAHDYQSPVFKRIASLRLHRIDGDSRLSLLGAGSKLDTRTEFIGNLFENGCAAADEWLANHRRKLGRQGTVDPAREFVD